MAEMKCEICNKVIKTNCDERIFNLFSRHLALHSELTKEEYYNKYCTHGKKDNLCLTCGKVVRFNNIRYGYYEHCDKKCGRNDKNLQNRLTLTNNERWGGTGFKSEILRKKCNDTYYK